MARMIGTAQWHQQCPYGCCRGMVHRSTVKAREKREVTKEIELESAHGTFCGYDCLECYGESEDFDANSPEDLEGIPNVLYNGKEPPKIDFSTL